MFAAMLVSTVICFQAFIANSPSALSEFKTALYANAIVLGGFALWHLMRTPYLLHKEAEEQHGKQIAMAIEQDRSAQKELFVSIPTGAEWLQLSDRFKTLPHARADWQTTRGETRWSLHDSTTRSICSLAGSMLLNSRLIETQYPLLLSQPDHLERWLSYIKETKWSDNLLHGEEDLPDGTKLFHYMGSIEVPKNSVDICVVFAAHSNGGRV